MGSIDPRFLSLSGAGDYFVGSHRADNLGLFSVDNMYVQFMDPVDLDYDYYVGGHSSKRRHRKRGRGGNKRPNDYHGDKSDDHDDDHDDSEDDDDDHDSEDDDDDHDSEDDDD